MSIFSTDSKLTVFLNTLGNLMVLNVLSLVCALPIVTAGASFAALYTMTMRIVRKEETSLWGGFFLAFKDNFKNATIIWLVGAGLIAFMTFDIKMLQELTGTFGQVYRVVLLVLAALLAMILMHALALTARFENTVINTLKNAAIIVVSHLPQAILMLMVVLIPVALLHLSMRFISVDFLIGLSGPAWLASVYFCDLFKNFE